MKKANKNMQKILKNLLTLTIIFLVVASLFSVYVSPKEKTEKISFSQLVAEIQKEEVKNVEIEDNKLNVLLNDNKTQIAYKEGTDSLSTLFKNYEVPTAKIEKVNISIKEQSSLSFWLGTILPFVLPFLIVGLIIYWMSRQVQKGQMKAMMFGQTKTKPTNNPRQKVSFKDVAGVKEAKEELKEVVEFLKSPKKFTALGARVPRGVLLLGHPGCGKTLLARAVAGEANVPFFNISGSEFVEMFVGVGASRVRDLFEKAKKNAPAIIFIDELDAVGRQRGAGLGGSHDEREQTLNQILVEMDGFDVETNLIVMAATNRPDVLDPALLRPGRFDRHIIIDLPDIKDREEILRIHAQNKPLVENISLREIAERTPGFSGADLANLLNEAAIAAVRHKKTKISLEEILDSIEKVMLGPERKSHLLSKEEKMITAYHEAGHALVSHLLPGATPVRKVSIIARGQAAGYTLKLPTEEKYLRKKSEFVDEISSLLGGYVAEKEILGEVTTGATNDLKQATDLAKRLITEYGMSANLGPRTFGKKEELIFLGREITEQRDYSEKTAQSIDEEISGIIEQAFITAEKVIKENKEQLEKIAQLLIKQETIEQKEFNHLFKK